MYKWHRILIDMRSMTIYLLGYQGLFSYTQEACRHVKVKRLMLIKGVNQDLAYFRWLSQDLEQQPTRLYKLVPLYTTLDVYHNASG